MKYKYKSFKIKIGKPYKDIWTGITLTPSLNGKRCLGNGKCFYTDGTPIEICCDNCNTYNYCFPDWLLKRVYDIDIKVNEN